MRDGILVVDAQGRIVDLNHSMKAIIRLPDNQVIGWPATQILAPWKDLIEESQPGTETQFEAHLGEEDDLHHYNLRISPLHDQRGKFNGQLIVLHDITQRKYMEEERKRLIHKLQEALADVKK